MARTRKAFTKSETQTQIRFIPDDTDNANVSFIVSEKAEQKVTFSQFGLFPDRRYRHVEQAPQNDQEKINCVWSKACSPQNVS